MANTSQTYSTTIFINDEQAVSKMQKLEASLKAYRRAKDQALIDRDDKAFKTANQQIKACEKEMKGLRTTAQQVDHVLDNLSTSSVNDIKNTIKAISREMNNGTIERGSEQWKYYTEKLKEANAELKKIKEEQKPDDDGNSGIFGKIKDTLNTSWGFLTQGFEVFKQITDAASQYTQAYMDMEEAMANTTKYTGQSTEAIHAMNEEFKKMDTRTSREQLNELAGAAGRLGLTGHDEIMEFVDAADKINVALGDDLGEGAVDNIGKLAQTFGEIKRLGMKQALLATGSAINELAQKSSASAGYLVDFTARLAGIGKQAGMTQTQIMGYASVMDESMLRDEMAATAMSNLIAKMASDSSKFAKIAGANAQEFAQKVKTDMNGALIELFEGLKKNKSGLTELAPIFADMGLNGSQASQVLATLADKIDRVKENQKTAADAYREAKSVIEEFKVQNSTIQAQVDKANKKFHDLAVDLGEKLLPIVKYSITIGSSLISVLSAIIDFVIKYRTVLISVTAAIVTFRVAQMLSNKESALSIALSKTKIVLATAYELATNGLSRALVIAAAKQKILNFITKQNPYAYLASAIAAAIVWIVKLSLETKKLTEEERQQQEAQKALNKIKEEAAKKMGEEKTKIEQLRAAAMSETMTLADRQKAIDALNKIIPDYNAQLDTTTGKYKENKVALDKYLESLQMKYELEGARDTLKELGKEKAGLLVDKVVNDKAVHDAAVKATKAGRNKSTKTVVTADAFGNVTINTAEQQNKVTENAIYSNEVKPLTLKGLEIRKKLNDIDAKTKAINDYYGKGLQQLFVQESSEGNGNGGGGGGTTTTPAKTEAQRKAEEAAQAAALKNKKDADKAEQAELNLQLTTLAERYAAGLIDYRTYLDEREKLQLNSLEKRKKIWGKDSNEAKQMADDELKARQTRNEALKKFDEDEIERDRLKQEYFIKEHYAKYGDRIVGGASQQDEALFQNDMAALTRRLALEKKGTEEWLALKAEMEKREAEHRNQQQMAFIEQFNNFRKQQAGEADQQQMETELAWLNTFHDKGLLSEEEYQKALLALRLKYAKRTPTADEQTRQGASASLAKAEELAGPAPQIQSGGDDMGVTAFSGIFKIVEYRRKVNDQLKQLYGDDYKNSAEYQEAQRQNSQAMFEQIVSAANAAYSGISNIMNAASAYAQACSQLETARITADYDKQIEAAGKNSKKKERLEKERDKKLAAAKTKANRKAMKIEIAQAFASTAMAAINAYASASKEHWLLGAVAAAMATAAGMMQIATIKKQHQAEEAGYYEGGFTGGSNYRREAGVVHEGEFVANHRAVANTAILPALQLIDTAQRNNTIANLTAADVSRAVGVGSTTVVSAPTVNVVNDNSQVEQTMATVTDAVSELSRQLAPGIKAYVVIDGTDGLDAQYRRYKRLKN